MGNIPAKTISTRASLKWLRDPAFWISNTLALVVTVFGQPISQWLWDIRSGKLRVELAADVDLMSAISSLPLDVTWNDPEGISGKPKPVKTLRYARIVVQNIGGQQIEWADVTRQPVTFRVDGDGRILWIRQRTDDGPKGRVANSRVSVEDQKSFSYSFEYIKPGQAATFDVFYTGGPNAFSVTGRQKDKDPLTIVDVATEPQDVGHGTSVSIWTTPLGAILGAAFITFSIQRVRTRLRPNLSSEPATDSGDDWVD
jgi:hypothetical protein